MERVDRILGDAFYQKALVKNQEAEADRVFCRHDLSHALDVARIARIEWMEKRNAGIAPYMRMDLEVIYAAALLHDIGRFREYTEGMPHEVSSGKLAEVILSNCGYSAAERDTIVEAVKSHKDGKIREEESLRGLLYRADKASRPCFLCPVSQECNWSVTKKNLKLKY